MAQLFKGHVVDDGQYPIPPDPRQPRGAEPGAPSVNADDIQRAAGELESLVRTVGALAPKVRMMQEALEASAQQQGYTDGLARAQAEVQEQLMQAIAALTEAQRQRHLHAQQNEAALADLALRIARKVIGAHLQADPTLIARIVHSTIAELEPTTALEVRVNPQDLAAVEAERVELQRLVTSPGALNICADEEVDPGGCMLISPVGDVDARITTKLHVLETAFKAQRRQLIDGQAGE